MTASTTATILVRAIYAVAVVVALVPFLALAMDPGDPWGKHVIRFIACPLVGAAIAGVGMLLSLLLKALVLYIERREVE